MVKKIKLDAKNIALLAALGFAWTKLGLGTAVREVGILPALSRDTPVKPDGTCPAGWIKAGNRCLRL